jgi:catechol 2,3-dioxygenase
MSETFDDGKSSPEPGVRESGYRLPAETRLGRVRLQISDLARSLEYYERVLGFRVVARAADLAVLATLDSGTELIELHERKGAAPAPSRGQLGLFHFAILLPDRGALGRLHRHLTTLGVYAGASDHLVSEALYLQDPDGLGIEVYSDRPRDSWLREGGQLMMDTRPLDIADLERAAGGESWAGMPAGTSIGHVHLAVGDIVEAQAYYVEAVGFDRTAWSYPGALFMSAGGYHHHLGVNTWAGAGARPPAEDSARLLDWEILVPRKEDVAAAAASLRASGYAVQRTEGTAAAEDPWGTGLLIAPSTRAASTEGTGRGPSISTTRDGG